MVGVVKQNGEMVNFKHIVANAHPGWHTVLTAHRQGLLSMEADM